MSGIPRSRQNIRGQAAEVRHAVHGNSQCPAPRVIYARVGQLWIDFQHRFTGFFGEVFREPIAITLASAEQHPVVLGQAKIIDDELAVGDCYVVTDQTAGSILAQRFGSDDKVVNRHHPRRDLRLQIAEVSVRAQRHKLGDNFTVFADNLRRFAPLDIGHPRFLENPNACRNAGSRQPQCKIQRMQMPGTPVHGPTAISVRPDRRAKRGLLHIFDLLVSILGLQFFDVRLRVMQMFALQFRMQNTRFVSAGDVMLGDQVANRRFRLLAHIPQLPRMILANHLLQIILLHPLTGPDLPAVATRRPKA